MGKGQRGLGSGGVQYMCVPVLTCVRLYVGMWVQGAGRWAGVGVGSMVYRLG